MSSIATASAAAPTSATTAESIEIGALSGWRRQVFGACLHRHVVPVESVVDGTVLARLCVHCDEQLPA